MQIPVLLATLAVAFLTSSANAAPSVNAPPQNWVEHWFEHVQNLQLVFSDDDVAVYFDSDVVSTITWPNKYIGDVWRYVKKVYGNFGPENNVYAIYHSGKYSGGHPSTYFDAHHDYRNVIDCGSNSLDAWVNGDDGDLSITTHELAHIVEIGSKSIHGSPAFGIWGDSKWAEIFNYDVYKNLGMKEVEERWYTSAMNARDNFPRENTAWFRDWFYPIYSQYGETDVLNNYFEELATHFPSTGTEYDRGMNWGEFVHFWSGAAGVNLKDLATNAFGWPNEYEQQFQKAQADFPGVTYDGK